MKIVTTLLILLLACSASVRVSHAAAKTKEMKAAERTEKIAKNITKLGIGESSRIHLRLKDGPVVKGYLREAGDTSCVVVNFKTGEATVVAYDDVKQVAGHNLTTGQKVLIGFAIAAAVLITLALIGLHYAD